MQNSWGYLTSGQGYGGHIFPVVIGESGTQYLTVSTMLHPCELVLRTGATVYLSGGNQSFCLQSSDSGMSCQMRLSKGERCGGSV